MLIRFVIAIFLSLSLKVKAQVQEGFRGQGWCGSIFRSPSIGCDDVVRSNSIGGSYPLLFDAFNINPASLPTYPTPVGVEAFYDFQKVNLSMIKGFKEIGTGFSFSNTENNFFSNANNVNTAILRNAIQSNTDPVGEFNRNLNFGTSFNLLGKKGSFIQLSGGLSIRYDEEEENIETEFGSVLKSKFVSFGFNYRKQNEDEHVNVYNVGMKVGNLYVDFTRFENRKVNTATVATNIISVNYSSSDGYQFSLATRRQYDDTLDEATLNSVRSQGVFYRDKHMMAGLSKRFNDKLMVGYYIGYILSRDASINLQYLF